ncbi:hypothetical protein Tco_0392405 [Tanacetum coccineum]
MTSVCDMVSQIMQKKEEDKRIAEDQATKDQYWKIPICYNDDDDDVEDLVHTPSESDSISEGNGNDHFNAESSLIESVLNRENVISSPKIDSHLEEFAGELAFIAPIPPGIVEADLDPKEDIRFIENLMYDNSFPRPLETLKDNSETVIDSNDDSTSSDDDSPYGEDIDYVYASPPDVEIVSLEVMESVIPEVGGIDTDILLTIKDDILREKLLNVNLLIAKIKALKNNPVPSSDIVTKSSSTSLNLFLEETNTFDNSLTESKTFCFDLEEISSGSTTTHFIFSLSKYDSFIFDLSINPFPPADRSDFYHKEFANELAHIISPPEYDCFYFKNEPELGDFTMDVVGDIFPTRVHMPNILPTHPTLHQDLDFILSSDSLFAYIVWIFLPFLTYPVTPPYLLSTRSEDTIFNPDIST